VSGDTSSAAVAGSPRACTTSGGRWRAGWGRAGVSMLFCHEGFETFTARSDGNNGMRRGVWLCDGPLSPGPILGHPGFWPGIAIIVQFSHREGGFGVRAGADDGVSRVGTHVLGVRTTEAVLKEDLENGGQGALLSKGQSSDDEVGWGRGLGDQDCATCPMTYGWICAVILVCLPETEWEGFQRRRGVVIRDVVELCLSLEFGKVKVLPLGTWPVRGEDTRVCTHRLSIKLNGQGEDIDEGVWVEKTLHPQGARE